MREGIKAKHKRLTHARPLRKSGRDAAGFPSSVLFMSVQKCYTSKQGTTQICLEMFWQHIFYWKTTILCNFSYDCMSFTETLARRDSSDPRWKF